MVMKRRRRGTLRGVRRRTLKRRPGRRLVRRKVSKFRRSFNSIRVIRGRPFFQGDRMRLKMVYEEPSMRYSEFKHGSVNNVVYNICDLTRPNASETTGQAVSQLGPLQMQYSTYIVRGVKIQCWLTRAGGTTGNTTFPINVGLTPISTGRDNTTTALSYAQYIGQSGTIHRSFNYFNGNRGQIYFSKYFSVRKIEGRPLDMNYECNGDTKAPPPWTPERNPKVHFWYGQPQTVSASGDEFIARRRLTFYVEWYRKRIVPAPTATWTVQETCGFSSNNIEPTAGFPCDCENIPDGEVYPQGPQGPLNPDMCTEASVQSSICGATSTTDISAPCCAAG